MGANDLGLDPLGIEIDDAACATGAAAGFRTLQADVSTLDPLDFAPVAGIIASAPCQAFSMAGSGEGRRALPIYQEAIRRMLDGDPMTVAELDEACDDPRGHLVLEPLRWTLALRPTWLVCEQVEPVLPLWEVMGDGLRRLGYSVWMGVLGAEQYGVPQTRRRAILLARRDGKEARQPPPTHQRYIPPRRRGVQEESLFEPPAPVRIVAPGEDGLLPWVSMAEALGWGMTGRPTNMVTATSGNGGPRPLDGGAHARKTMDRAQADGEWEPVTTGIEVEHRRGGDRLEERWSADRPSDTVTSRTDRWQAWGPARVRRDREGARSWTPADHRAEPGHHDSDMSGRPQQMNAVRVSIQEAAILQSFPPDYPWQGTRAKVFTQIGNAVPPLLARAVLAEVTA